MKIKRIKSIKINSYEFAVIWDNSHNRGSFNYVTMKIIIGTKDLVENEIFMILCHELQEICAEEMSVRFQRPDCSSDYLFVYDHRQHDTLVNMFSGLLSQFLR